jgi:hypothetical protein
MKPKELSYLFENKDAFQIYTEEVRDAELFRDSYYLFEEISRNNPEILNEFVGKALKAAGSGIVAGAKAAWNAGVKTWKNEGVKEEIVKMMKGKDFSNKQDQSKFLQEVMKKFPEMATDDGKKAIESLINQQADAKTSDNGDGGNSKDSGEEIDINKSDAEVEINKNIKSLKTINSSDFMNAFKEAKNDPKLRQVIDDPDFINGIKKAVDDYMKNTMNDAPDKWAHEAVRARLQKNPRDSKPIRYAAAAMMKHMIDKVVPKRIDRENQRDAEKQRVNDIASGKIKAPEPATSEPKA